MNDNENLQSQIDELKRRLDERDAQQIVFPLDVNSVNVLNRYFMRITGSIITTGGAGGNTFVEYNGNQNGTEFLVGSNTYVPFTVIPSADTLTVTKQYFDNGTLVNLYTSDTLPAPFVTGTDYYVVNASATGLTFKLSATFGGAAIDITTSGTGTQYISTF